LLQLQAAHDYKAPHISCTHQTPAVSSNLHPLMQEAV